MKPTRRTWQDAWTLDSARGLAVHESGLRVRLQAGVGVAENAADIEQVFIAGHGSHNAPAMVRRLTREGGQMLIDPSARGWRK